ATELKQIVAAAGTMPVILLGDFNAVPTAPSIAAIREFLTDVWTAIGTGGGFTIPVKKPARRIDYVWITPATITPVKMEVITSDIAAVASDHLPIVAELQLK
ncbi:MAG: endonuclease/exonuclease/phosphatase family protein, partial [Verrucomicrobiota bacterium]